MVSNFKFLFGINLKFFKGSLMISHFEVLKVILPLDVTFSPDFQLHIRIICSQKLSQLLQDRSSGFIRVIYHPPEKITVKLFAQPDLK